jgi:uncharacterized protein (DUF1015 family)
LTPVAVSADRFVRPLRGLRPAQGWAQAVAAPPYDVVSRAEAAALAAGKPTNFLHVSRAEIDLSAETNPYAPVVYAKALATFTSMIQSGVLRRDADAMYYAYRMERDGRSQTGIVVAASVAAYRNGDIRRHELTRPDKEDDRVRNIEVLNAQTGPVMLAHRPLAAIAAVLRDVTSSACDSDATTPDGTRHRIWPVADRAQHAALDAALAAVPRFYIADGHHRSAAAARVAAARPESDSAACFLAVTFPADEMHILDYNRVVRDLAGLTPESFLARVRERFTIAPAAAALRPDRRRRFGLYVGGRWYRIEARPQFVPTDDPVRRLDVSLLADNLLAPVLGIADPRSDPRIDFVGGSRGVAALAERVDSGEAKAAFALFPTAMGDLIAVADAGEIMPPKSTWFDPKLADGLVSHILD